MTGFEGYATETPKPAELQAYEDRLLPETVRIACRAIKQLQPVTVTLHRGRSDIGINRRRRNPDGIMGMGPNPDGVYNPDLWLLDITAGNNDDRCVLFCYGCHPVIVYGFAWDGLSADYPGVCRGQLKEQLGQNVHCQFIQGLAGNVRPRRLADLDAGRFRKSTPEDPNAVGAELAGDILAALSNRGEPLALNIAAADGFFQARRDPEQIPSLEHWQSLAEGEDELGRNLGQYWANRLQSGLPPTHSVPWAIGLLHLTPDCTIAWLAGEAVAEWLGHLRDWLDDDRLIAWAYSQDGRGYLPTDELLPEGGYEVVQANSYSRIGPGPFAHGLNESARQGFLSLAQQIEYQVARNRERQA